MLNLYLIINLYFIFFFFFWFIMLRYLHTYVCDIHDIEINTFFSERVAQDLSFLESVVDLHSALVDNRTLPCV